jgi:hypothetical protein
VFILAPSLLPSSSEYAQKQRSLSPSNGQLSTTRDEGQFEMWQSGRPKKLVMRWRLKSTMSTVNEPVTTRSLPVPEEEMRREEEEGFLAIPSGVFCGMYT